MIQYMRMHWLNFTLWSACVSWSKQMANLYEEYCQNHMWLLEELSKHTKVSKIKSDELIKILQY